MAFMFEPSLPQRAPTFGAALPQHQARCLNLLEGVQRAFDPTES